MDRQKYCDRVLARTRHLTRRERAAVRAELDGHMEDHMEALLELDYPPELAEERALAAMGDPEETGRALDKEYPLGWLIASRAMLAALAAVCLMVLLSRPSLYQAGENLRARFSPMSEKDAEAITLETDIRVPVGSDVLYVYGSGVSPEDREAAVFFCWYDQNPFHYANEDPVTFTDCRGAPCEALGGGGYSTAAVSFRRQNVRVEEGDPFVTLHGVRNGTAYEARIPLRWEERP